jgi:hypothetical protein
MSIEAIKEALKAEPTDGPWTVEVGDSPSVAIANDVMLLAKTLGDNDDANAAFIAACNPTAIRALIERLEAAEKDAARYAWLRDSHPADGGVWAAMGIPNTHAGISCWRHEELDAAIDSAMDGGLAEGVSDA